MNRLEMAYAVAKKLRQNNTGKIVPTTTTTFRVSDEFGNFKDFHIKDSTRKVAFLKEDVNTVMEACISVIEDVLKRGESINIQGVGSICLHQRAQRTTRHPVTGEQVIVPARFVPKFMPGSRLRLSAKMYELSLPDSASFAESLCGEYDDSDNDEIIDYEECETADIKDVGDGI